MANLEVRLYGVTVGHLTGGSWRTFDFVTSQEGIDHFGIGATVLSESVPLVVHQPRGRAGRRRNFFDELLPEGMARQRLAENARVAATDTLELLTVYGRDVAGAIQVLSTAANHEEEIPRARDLAPGDIANLLNDVAAFPLGNAPLSGKASLAGVQEKILLALHDGQWSQCLYGHPSTHILKPVNRLHSDMIYNEEYASRIARALGLSPYATWIETFESTEALVIERYDRNSTAPGGRLHQEDFNQVLGATGGEKYQENGGKVSLARIASVVAAAQGREALDELLRMVVLAVVVGNLDMHAKNISLLHPPYGAARLAPAYDVVPLTHYPGIDGRMAMSINNIYEHSEITRFDLIAEGMRWGMAQDRATTVLDEALPIIRSTIQQENPHPRAMPGLANLVSAQATKFSV